MDPLVTLSQRFRGVDQDPEMITVKNGVEDNKFQLSSFVRRHREIGEDAVVQIE
jgi:hypothetical protein